MAALPRDALTVDAHHVRGRYTGAALSDLRPARWVRQVVRLRVVQVPAPRVARACASGSQAHAVGVVRASAAEEEDETAQYRQHRGVIHGTGDNSDAAGHRSRAAYAPER
jgi:hypothetical protein